MNLLACLLMFLLLYCNFLACNDHNKCVFESSLNNQLLQATKEDLVLLTLRSKIPSRVKSESQRQRIPKLIHQTN